MRRRSRERDGFFQNFLFLCLKKVIAIEENKKRCKGLRTSKSRTNVSTENNHSTHEKLKKIVNPTQPAVRVKNFDSDLKIAIEDMMITIEMT